MHAMLAQLVAAVSTVAFLSSAAPARSNASAPSPAAMSVAHSCVVSTAVSLTAPVSALAAAPQLRHAQAAALLTRLERDLTAVRGRVRAMRALAVAAMNGLLTPAERAALDTEFQQHLFQLQQLALASQSSGVQLLDGSQPSVELQIDPALPQLLTLWLPDCRPMSLSIDWLDVTSAANAASAFVACDTALDVADSALAATRAAALGLGL